MKRRSGSVLLLFTAFVILICQGPPQATAGDVPGTAPEQTNLPAGKTTALLPDVRFGELPLYFIPNQGQADPRALFYAKTPGYTLWVTKEGLVFDSVRCRDAGDRPGREATRPRTYFRDVSRLVFLGANKNPGIVSLQPRAHKVNYFKGNDPGKWRGDIPTAGAVLYQNLYKNIDLKVRGIGKQIEYDWIVRPGGEPAQIQFAYQNVEKTGMNRSGDLEIRTGTGTLVHKRPAAYQEKARAALAAAPGLETRRAPVQASFKDTGRNRYGFAIGEYDRERELIIDPVVLVYSTYLGGSTPDDEGYGIALDPGGFVYVTGYTNSFDFPTLNSYQGAQGGYDGFVTKLTMGYTVSAVVSGSNGTVSPAAQAVYEGEKATIHIFPAAGYAIAAITDNGLRAAVRNPYTVSDVREDHEVVVTFACKMYRVTAWVTGGNGVVSPASQDIQHGTDAAIHIRPDAGCDIASIADNDLEAVVANPYVIREIDRDHAVEVRFKKTLYPPQLNLTGVRKTERAWIIRKDYAELTLAIVENASPMPVAAYVLRKSVNGVWSELNRYPAAGNYLYTDKYLDRGESAQYKLTALAADGTTVAETEILSL